MKLEQARQYALSLTEAVEEPHFEYTSFRVRGKIFATAPLDGAHLHIFVGEALRETAIALQPLVCEKLNWGAKVVGLRLALAKAPPTLVRDLLLSAWQRKAPKSLVKPG